MENNNNNNNDKAYLTGNEFIEISIHYLNENNIENINIMFESVKWSSIYIKKTIELLYLTKDLKLADNLSLIQRFINILPNGKLETVFSLFCNSDNKLALYLLQTNPSLNINEYVINLCNDPDDFNYLKDILNSVKNIDINKIIEHLYLSHNYSLFFWFYKNNKIVNLNNIDNLSKQDKLTSIGRFIHYLQNNNNSYFNYLSEENRQNNDILYNELVIFSQNDNFHNDNEMYKMCDNMNNKKYEIDTSYLIKKIYDNDVFILINFIIYYENINNFE
jgi:hypothetical protein